MNVVSGKFSFCPVNESTGDEQILNPSARDLLEISITNTLNRYSHKSINFRIYIKIVL
jgi:hypothetical protein